MRKFFILGIDKNGNKIIKVKKPGCRGFSIQTLGNLPKTHRLNNVKSNSEHEIVNHEVINYVYMYGTNRQRSIIGV